MLIKNLEKLRKRTLRERIYEEVVRLILAGTAERRMGGREAVIDKLRVSRTPFARQSAYCKGRAGRDQALSRLLRAQLFPQRDCDLYELFKRLECFAVELSVPQMSDHDIRGFENILFEAGAALQHGDTKKYAMRDREFYENLAEQSGNSALTEALARVALQIQLCATMASVARSLPSAPRRLRRHHTSIQGRDTPRAAFLVRGRISHTQRQSLRAFPMRQRLAKAE